MKWNRSNALIHVGGAALKPSRPAQSSIEGHNWFADPGPVQVEMRQQFQKDLVAA